MSGKVDPDSLPSVEVRLIPPKMPFPQVQEELRRFHVRMEQIEKMLMRSIKIQYTKSLQKLIRETSQLIVPRIKALVGSKSKTGVFLQEEDDSRNIENVAISVLPMPTIDLRVKGTIKEIYVKRQSDEKTQIDAAVKEFPKMADEIINYIKTSFQKNFRGSIRRSKGPSLLQRGEDKLNGINPVLNVRIGSSNSGDGLLDGSSFPSVVSLVEDENEKQNQGESTLLNSVLFYTRQLGIRAIKHLYALLRRPKTPVSSFLEPSSAGEAAKEAMAYLPPAIPRVIRRHALEYSTVQFDISPPEPDYITTREQLNAMLEAEMVVQSSRRSAYIQAKKSMMKEILRGIDKVIREAAINWGMA